MTAQLPPNLLKLFAPRPALPYARPVGKSPNTIRQKTVDGVAALLAQIKDDAAFTVAEKSKGTRKIKKEEPNDDVKMNGDANGDNVKEEGEEEDEGKIEEDNPEDLTKVPGFTYAEEVRRQIAREEKAKKRAESFEKAKSTYAPNENKKAKGDPYKTLFISRLSKKATEADLRREFENYGVIEHLTVVKDEKGRSRGYGFIVYDREKDMKAAYKDAEGLVILGKKILVDVERGRTVRGWKPRRLGGGLGGKPKPVPAAAAEPAPPAFGGGGFGGGRGGGFRGRGGGGFGDRGGGGGFRGRGGGGFGGDRGGFGGGDRGGGGFRGGFSDRGGGGGGFGAPDRGYGDRGRGGPPGGFGGPDRGGAGGGYGGGDRGGSGGFGGPPGGGYGRGRGVGFQGGFNSNGPPSGYGAPVPPGGGSGGYSGGYGGGHKRDYDGGDDRDQKRTRY